MNTDCTEFKFQHATNLDLSILLFSHYKNTQTGKALIGISPHGSGLLFSGVYPGSITDSALTELTEFLNMVEPEHKLMTDREFAVQEYCSSKGIYSNRPAQKNSNQFEQGDVASHFDIAATCYTRETIY